MNEKAPVPGKSKNAKTAAVIFFALCLVLLIIDLFIHKHAHFAWEEKPEFFAVFGFVSCIVIVLSAKYILRNIVKRNENYYD